MPHIELHHQVTGRGEPLVLVHGGWSDHRNWQAVVPGLSQTFRVVACDRRGHGASTCADQGTRRDQEDDLALLIEALDLGPVHVAGTSFGASIALGLATRRPSLVRSVIAHEPPLVSVVAGDPDVEPLLAEVDASIRAVIAEVEAGSPERAARRFVEEVALGPGAWVRLPGPLRATMIRGARAFAAEQRDPDWARIDPAALGRVECPVLLTQGDASPAWFRPIVGRLAALMGGAALHTYRGAGHAPHLTHADDYVEAATAFLARPQVLV